MTRKIKSVSVKAINTASVIVVAGILCYILWLLTRVFLFDQFVIPSESMAPTLVPGDRIIVSKATAGARIYTDFEFKKEGGELKSRRTRGLRRVRPNDIVVFNFPHHGGKISFVINDVYAKRCIGVPGDSVAVTDGVFQNTNFPGPIGLQKAQEDLRNTPDSVFPDMAMRAMPHDPHVGWTIKNLGPLYLPRKGDYMKLAAKDGCLYRMALEWETGKKISVDWENDRVLADGMPIDSHVFAHGYYFLCGDNVSNSSDSRYWGMVPGEYIVGVVSRVSYSVDRRTGKYRADRILKSLE